jgi:hypothetical protein
MARNEQRLSEQGYEMLTVQCRMARAGLAWGVCDLAGAAHVRIQGVETKNGKHFPNLNTLLQPLDVSRELGRLQFHCKTWGVDKSCLKLEMHSRACVGRTPLLGSQF